MTFTATEGARRFDVAHRTLRPKTHPGWRLVFSNPEGEVLTIFGPYKAKLLERAAKETQAALGSNRLSATIIGRLAETREPADRFDLPLRREDPSCVEIIVSLSAATVISGGTMRPLPI